MDFSKKKISDLLVLLSHKDRNNLKKYISSPYHVKQGNQIVYLKLLDLIWQNPKQNYSESERDVFRRIFPDKTYVPGKVDKKISQLCNVVLDFLGQEQIKKGTALKLAALSFIREKGESRLFLKEYNKITKQFAKSKNTLLDGPLVNFELDLEEFRFYSIDSFQANQSHYDFIYDSLDKLYMHYFLNIGIRNLAYKRFIIPLELKSRFDLLIKLFSNKDDNSKTENQLFQEHIFTLLSDSAPVGEEQIQNLARRVERIKKKINLDTYKNYRIIIRNFTVYRYNYGDTSLGPVLFQLYKSEVEDKLIFYKDKIYSAAVNNITIVAIRQNEFKWLDQFLDDISEKIYESNLQEFTLALNRSKLLFSQSKFDEVLDLLIFDVKEIYLKVYARILELMSYFELSSDQFSHKLEAYKIFIYRLPKTKVWEDFITGHNNFIRILKSIAHPSTAFDKNRIEKLKSKIEKTKILAEKPWLLEKVRTLEKRNR